ncbi:SIS domain-containing protein [Aerococcaceae bacterium DSM 111022]|nr:SIS domain-containing protein [Aerococcaceae bacterium DSM 111022]
MNYKEDINRRIEILKLVLEKTDVMNRISDIIFITIDGGNKVLTAGNGGSAANAQHITGDIVGRYKIEREAFPAISLTVDPSVMTAVANDYGYSQVFARQVEGLGNENDLLIVLSSSATSENLVEAVKKANNNGIKTIGILGNNGGVLSKELDESICFEFSESDLVEETAMAIFHMILKDVEDRLNNRK